MRSRLLSVSSALSVLSAPITLSVPSVLLAQSGIVHDPFPIRLAFTGDINLGTRTLPDGIPPDSGRQTFAQVDSLLKGDLVVGNFEGVLSDSGWSYKCGPPPDTTAIDSTKAPKPAKKPAATKKPKPPSNCYAFATPTWLAPRLKEAGFTHLNLANNHANDYGLDARLNTEDILRTLGLTPYGPLEEIAITPVFRDERMTLVGLIGFSTYPNAYNLLEINHSAALVDSLRGLVDLLVVTFHGGTEGKTAVRTGNGPEFLAKEPRGDLRKWARAVIDAGADAVVGHGPHVLRGVEFYKGKPIFYSLGNFATYRGFNLAGPLGVTAVLQLNLSGEGKFEGARMVPLLQIPGAGPAPDSTSQATTLINQVTALDFPGTGARLKPDGTVVPP
ncbi:MAG TPA: CapA family protein [Gemmatimonadales bacterium]|nr:CapA family protein [Gemmatimonadales bacterium]